MQFSQIPGQQSAKDYYLEITKSEKIPHAMMLGGNSGTGKLALAIAFATYLLCENRGEKDSCGQCSSCLKAAKSIHPDIHFSFPVVKVNNKDRKDVTSKNFLSQWRSLIDEHPFFDYNNWLTHIQAGNDQGNINKKECVDIIQKLSLNSFEGEQKILILWKAEMLGDIGNVLLKLIEEPPTDTIIILITDNTNLVLNTLTSRCQILKTIPFQDNEMEQYLITHYGNRDWSSVIRLANGNIQKAISLQNGISTNYSEELINWLRIAYVSDTVKINKWVLNLDRQGKDNISLFLTYGIHFFRAYQRSFYLPADKISLSSEELQHASKMKKIIQYDQLVEIVSLLDQCYSNIKRNGNSKILLTNLCLKLEAIMKGKLTYENTMLT